MLPAKQSTPLNRSRPKHPSLRPPPSEPKCTVGGRNTPSTCAIKGSEASIPALLMTKLNDDVVVSHPMKKRVVLPDIVKDGPRGMNLCHRLDLLAARVEELIARVGLKHVKDQGTARPCAQRFHEL